MPFYYFPWLILLFTCHSSLFVKAKNDVIFSSAGSNTCPENYAKITSSKWACIAAMAIGDPTLSGDQHADNFNGEEKDGSFPSGCYECPKNTNNCLKGTWFNAHPTGASNQDARLFCAKNTLSLERPENGIIFMGDSDVDYWSDSRKTLPGSFNYGIGGHTCQKVYNDFTSLLRSVQNIQWMVLVCCENDLTSGASVNTVYKRFQKIYDAASRKGIRIIMMGTKPEPSTKKLHKKYVQYDKKLKKFAKKMASKSGGPPFIFIDSYKSFKSLGNSNSLYSKDKLHLSAKGYKYWDKWLTNTYDNALCDDYDDDYDVDDYGDICKCYIWKKNTCVKKQK